MQAERRRLPGEAVDRARMAVAGDSPDQTSPDVTVWPIN
nr:hypothetical protein [Kibdelosporangium sp. MJ126-NF4]CTQ98143.1 hypothetical protein [Kibdelosporangium sp. MJ126-NF4]